MAHLPPLKMEKHYYKPHIEDMKKRLSEVNSLGKASTEEWIKGLEAEGKARIDDATRWEQWEYKGGLKKINSRPPPKSLPEPGPPRNGISVQYAKGEVHSDRSTPQLGPVTARTSSEYVPSTPSAAIDMVNPTANVMRKFRMSPLANESPLKRACSSPSTTTDGPCTLRREFSSAPNELLPTSPTRT